MCTTGRGCVILEGNSPKALLFCGIFSSPKSTVNMKLLDFSTDHKDLWACAFHSQRICSLGKPWNQDKVS